MKYEYYKDKFVRNKHVMLSLCKTYPNMFPDNYEDYENFFEEQMSILDRLFDLDIKCDNTLITIETNNETMFDALENYKKSIDDNLSKDIRETLKSKCDVALSNQRRLIDSYKEMMIGRKNLSDSIKDFDIKIK